MSIDPATFRNPLLQRLAELDEQDRISAKDRDPVTLDQESVGRLSRIDAMQVQAMALAQKRRRKAERAGIAAALQRIEEGEFGYCIECGDQIRLLCAHAVAIEVNVVAPHFLKLRHALLSVIARILQDAERLFDAIRRAHQLIFQLVQVLQQPGGGHVCPGLEQVALITLEPLPIWAGWVPRRLGFRVDVAPL